MSVLHEEILYDNLNLKRRKGNLTCFINEVVFLLVWNFRIPVYFVRENKHIFSFKLNWHHQVTFELCGVILQVPTYMAWVQPYIMYIKHGLYSRRSNKYCGKYTSEEIQSNNNNKKKMQKKKVVCLRRTLCYYTPKEVSASQKTI